MPSAHYWLWLSLLQNQSESPQEKVGEDQKSIQRSSTQEESTWLKEGDQKGTVSFINAI